MVVIAHEALSWLHGEMSLGTGMASPTYHLSSKEAGRMANPAHLRFSGRGQLGIHVSLPMSSEVRRHGR